MRTSFLAAVLVGGLALVLGSAPLEAQLKDVRVVRSDLLKAELNGKQVQPKLAGVWTPTPPGLGKKAECQGAEAREFVVNALSTQNFNIRGLAAPRHACDPRGPLPLPQVPVPAARFQSRPQPKSPLSSALPPQEQPAGDEEQQEHGGAIDQVDTPTTKQTTTMKVLDQALDAQPLAPVGAQ